jgi:hypothetical protein
MLAQITDYSKLEQRLQHDCNRALCRFLGGFRQELVRIDDGDWVRFTHPTWKYPRYPDTPEWHRRFFLPPLAEAGAVPSFPCSDNMREFYRFFDGLRECPPRNEGAFSQLSKVEKIGDRFRADWFPEFVMLRELPIVFTAANGDALAIKPDETFLWCQLETHETPQCVQSFSSLLQAWIAHHSVGDCHPFDSFGRD